MSNPAMTMYGESLAHRPERSTRRHAAIIPFRSHEEPMP